MIRRDDPFADPEAGSAAALAGAAAAMRETERAAAGLGAALTGGLRRAIADATAGGARLGDVVRGLAADMSAAGLRAAIRPAAEALGQGAAGAVSGAVAVLVGAAARPPRAFARGGVVQGATRFPLGEGVGLAGEAGAEAILPLARGADGRLGVRGGRGAMSVTLNVSSPDAESFVRARGQVAAALARAVDTGRRRL
jgi:phage-related minor tail protein